MRWPKNREDYDRIVRRARVGYWCAGFSTALLALAVVAAFVLAQPAGGGTWPTPTPCPMPPGGPVVVLSQ